MIVFLLIFSSLISFLSTFGTFNLNKVFEYIKMFSNYITPDTSTQFSIELNYFTKILYYFFYPNIFLFNRISIFELIVILENTILFLFFLNFLSFNKKIFEYVFLPFIFCLFFIIILPYITSNYGIASRQKSMILLPIIIILIYPKYFKVK
jgi:hypothetical protein